MENQRIIEKKREIRKAISILKKDNDYLWKLNTSTIITSHLENLHLFKNSNTVLLYNALPDEVQTSHLLNKWFMKKRILIPLVVDDDLILKDYSPDNVRSGYRGILEPLSSLETVSPSEVDLAIIPGVAFDSQCNRLGRGKGFYDRLIPNLSSPLIGLAFDFQIVNEVPVEIFDRKLDMVLTETRLFNRN